jgi:hypothetical protein
MLCLPEEIPAGATPERSAAEGVGRCDRDSRFNATPQISLRLDLRIKEKHAEAVYST